ncbi:DUF4233 domain-containing protein [Janibacter sp. GXQ6167]|uniref:DUF4233 domain-containing protein n=1 Tax=Janibacter sp. GXQ6167 TaxID=3240791 RepID=UPI0035246A8A
MQTAGKLTWRMLATVLGGQSIVIFFGALVARGLQGNAGESVQHSGTPFLIMTGVAILAIIAAGLMNRPGGILLGWIVQLLTLASAIWVPMMALIALIFGGLYLLCVIKGRQVDAMMAARKAKST